jgi:two-component sensor histidine kinase
MASYFSRRDSAPGTRRPAPPAARVGHVYLDVRRRVLHCLNDAARELSREGVPLTGADLAHRPLQTLAGGPVTAADLPLLRAWREKAARDAVFLMPAAAGAAPKRMEWHTAPLSDAQGEVLGVMGTVRVGPPEPDWLQLAGLAHDLRTPLQALRLLAPLLENTVVLAPAAAELIERMRAATDRALAIGMDLLEWARGPMQSGRQVTRAWFPLAPLAAELAAEQRPAAQRKGIGLHTDLGAAEGLEVHTDRVRLGRLLANLLANAVRYTSAGQVRFTATWRADDQGRPEALALGVVDTGAGISPEDQESIFQPFERGRAGKESDSGKASDSGGSGLGLAVVDRLVEELGLALEVFSEHGRGSSFELLLPMNLLRPQSVGERGASAP